MANVLERQENEKKSNVSSKGIGTLKQWCIKNGHGGVTRECILSAMQSQDPKIVGWAKKAVMGNMVKGKGR